MCRQPSSLNPPTPPCSLITLKVHSLPVSCTPRSCLRFLTQCQETDIMRPTRDCWAAPLAFADSTFFFFSPLLANFCAALMRRICTAKQIIWRKGDCDKQKQWSSRSCGHLSGKCTFLLSCGFVKKIVTDAGGHGNDAVCRQRYLWDNLR